MSLIHAPVPTSSLRPITVDEYHAMGRAGVFRPDERVELLDGMLLRKDRRDHSGADVACVGPKHLRLTNRLAAFFGRHRAESQRTFFVSVQHPVRLNNLSEPEPDVALLLPDYDEEVRLPIPSDALLLIEVSASTLAFDQGVKRSRYAAAGIGEVWIVSVDGLWIEVAHAPDGDRYTEIRRFALKDPRPLVPQALPDLPPLDLADLFRGMTSRCRRVNRCTSHNAPRRRARPMRREL